MSFLYEEYDPPHGDSDEGYWQVHLAVEISEKEAIARAAPAVVPGEHINLHAELIDGRLVLTMKVHATTREEARDLVGYQFHKIRAAAGLPQAPTTMLGHISPWWRSRSAAEELSREAHKLHEQGRHEFSGQPRPDRLRDVDPPDAY